MSKIGKKPILLPSGVTCSIDNDYISIKGSKGELKRKLFADINVEQKDNQIIVTPKNSSLNAKRFWGTTRAHINNMVIGVSEGFSKSLELNGVGYRAAIKGKELVMNLGFSHEVKLAIDAGVEVICKDPTHIDIKGIDIQAVGDAAKDIKLEKRPEPYKGKGFKYANEYILRKEGKKK